MEEPLSIEELRMYEHRLRDTLASLSKVVEGLEHEALEPFGESRSQPSDEAIESALLDNDLDALATEDELGYEVREALDRITEDAFGTCETCGEWISRKRLDILPHARRCSGCAPGPKAARSPGIDAVEDPCA
jgi:DnaK suppressor protein